MDGASDIVVTPRVRNWSVSAIALLVSLIAGSGIEGSSSGSLITSWGSARVCLPLAAGESRVTASSTVRNEGPEPVTIIAITPIDAHDAQLADADLVPMPTVPDADGSFTIAPGFGASYPPAENLETPASAALWADRRQAIGSVIAPETTWNLAYSVSTERAGSIQGLAIDYESANGQRHRTRTHLAVELRSQCLGSTAENA